MSQVFLSYASADRARVEPLVKALEAEGLQLWWDRDIDYGQSFHKVIEKALADASCVVVVWTSESIQSEWVVNEASEARQRNRLVPVLLDPVTPPLEFRHLQAADLSKWTGDSSDAQFIGLRKSLVAMLGRSEAPRPAAAASVPAASVPARQWWQTRPGQAFGAGALMIGLSLLLLALQQLGIVGSRQPLESTALTTVPSAPVNAPAGKTDATAQSTTRVPDTPTSSPAASPADRVNLLDTEAGAQLIAANEEGWKGLFSGKPTTANISTNGFAVLAFAGGKVATFDTIGVFVESTSVYNVKDLAIFTSSESPEGPFVKAAQLTVPNYRNMQKTFHELHFPPAQGRFVKLLLQTFHGRDGPNGYIGSIQLYTGTSGGGKS